MDIREMINVIWIVMAAGVIFVLPSTIYTAMFFGIFYRHKPLYLDRDDLTGTHYLPYQKELGEIIREAKGLECRAVSIRSRDKLVLAGRYYDRGADTTVVLVHGYQSDSFNNFSSLLKYFLSQGRNVLMIDQRAHGQSGGRFTTTGCKEQYDVMDWVAWLDQHTDCSSIFLYGISMGATTIGLASDKIKSPKVKGLIMEAGFTSFYEELNACVGRVFMRQAALNYIVLCAKHLLHADIKKSTVQALGATAIPVLFLHGESDSEVDLMHTRMNFDACASEKSLLIVEGAGHTLCHFIGQERVENAIGEFIATHQSQKRMNG
ncbi:MAG: alpha/beta hydrolase [Clostridia bacterium]|nr:alpha/beta hydrolase [Clostridia bacterium]